MKVAILGATGFTGTILIKLLANHPNVKEIIPVSSSEENKNIYSYYNSFVGKEEKFISNNQKFLSIEEAKKIKDIDVVIAALPHLKSANICKLFLNKQKNNPIIIDLSADLRHKDEKIFSIAYKKSFPEPELIQNAVYGLCEVNTSEISQAKIIANPGCFPTCSLLPLIPLCKKGILKKEIIINSITGISGAGKKLEENYLYSKRTENANAYSPGTLHRHLYEIKEQLSCFGYLEKTLFTPHLAPISQGMLCTTYAKLDKQVSNKDIYEIFKEFYQNKKFIRILKEAYPQTKDVLATNRCDISFKIEENSILLFSAIDNLFKGASSQAIQNMNIALGLKEETGLPISNLII